MNQACRWRTSLLLPSHWVGCHHTAHLAVREAGKCIPRRKRNKNWWTLIWCLTHSLPNIFAGHLGGLFPPLFTSSQFYLFSCVFFLTHTFHIYLSHTQICFFLNNQDTWVSTPQEVLLFCLSNYTCITLSSLPPSVPNHWQSLICLTVL